MVMPQTTNGEGQWPPRSPHDVLLSTPGGRDHLRRLADRTSPSPSPIKRSTSIPSFRKHASEILKSTMALSNVDEDDEDEETLQLKLQEIQARLKLKKLQKAKAKEIGACDTENDLSRKGAILLSHMNSAAASRSRQNILGSQKRRLERSEPQADIHVPVSPTRRVQSREPQRSPGRVLLGIDKGLKGSDISLRRAPSLQNIPDKHIADERQAAGYLRRAGSQASIHASVASRSNSSVDDKPKTFNERMADVRTQEADRREKDARIKLSRSKAFDIDPKEVEGYKSAAAIIPEIEIPATEFSRDQILHAYNKPVGGLLQRSKSASTLSSETITTSDSRTTSSKTATASKTRPPSRTKKQDLGDIEQSVSSEFESFSSQHLSKRIIPHTVLTRTLAGKKTFTIPDLLKVVVAPHFRLPDIEKDIILLAVIASKSEPRQHKAKATNGERGKYMVMTLTDLKWELDLFLFNSGFDKFWKLTPGTVIAILNPTIMPPMKADTGRFSLTLNSNEDTVLELGTARDLGFCKSIKKDGKSCDSWIDKRHTEYCEFHINEVFKKTAAGRMEVNTMNNGKRLTGSYGARQFNSRDMTGYEKPKKDNTQYDRETHSKIYVGAPMKGGATFVGGPGRSTANLLDDVDVDPDAFHRGTTKEERMRRQLAAIEKEREVARKLGKAGGGLGADYLRTRDQPAPASNSTVAEPPEAPLDATALGLLGGKTAEVHLSPIKRKRGATITQTSNTGMGWGGQLTKELGRMKDGERLQPVKKKTRFVTAKGIREAGRESFGDVAAPAPAPAPAVDDDDDEDDDDDLDVVK